MGWEYSGDVWEGSLNSVGSGSFGWSSTSGSSVRAYFLVFNSGGYLNPSSLDTRRRGFPIRCERMENARRRICPASDGFNVPPE